MSTTSSTSKYAAKKAAGNQMYGGNSSGAGTCCAHKRTATPVPAKLYWWGEARQERTDTATDLEVTADKRSDQP